MIALFIVLAALPSPVSLSSTIASNQDPTSTHSAVVEACGPSFFKLKGFYSVVVSEEHAACLDELALRLTQDPNLSLVIDGHRDSGERVGISITRAGFHRRYLVEDKLIDPARISERNFSDTCPHPEGEAALNARVEHWLLAREAGDSDIAKAKRCANSSTPLVATTEKALPWKGKWKSEGLY
jgi:hypothetical protein